VQRGARAAELLQLEPVLVELGLALEPGALRRQGLGAGGGRRLARARRRVAPLGARDQPAPGQRARLARLLPAARGDRAAGLLAGARLLDRDLERADGGGQRGLGGVDLALERVPLRL